ncbi:MAG: hypothetical protein EBX16_08150, partial [Burkholderiaceae bacterium]|nr:hypothetical protein [Burkholderiaceae bacterium]
NQLGIGAQGLGGLATVLDVKIIAWNDFIMNDCRRVIARVFTFTCWV